MLLELAKDHAIARIIWEHRKLRTLLNRRVAAQCGSCCGAASLFCDALAPLLQGGGTRTLNHGCCWPVPHCRFVQGFKMHLAYAEAVSYPGGLQLKRIRGSINQTCADTGGLDLL